MSKDYTNTKSGRLTFTRPTEKRAYSGCVVWEAICDCGKTTYVAPYRGTESCGCLEQERAKQMGERTRKFVPKISSARKIWRGHYRDCEFETFLILSQQPCFYCGALPHRNVNVGSRKVASIRQRSEGTFTYNGLDRLDSTKGHTKDNIVPCCWACNLMKRTLTLSEFLYRIEMIYKHTEKIRGETTPDNYEDPPHCP